jgi:hypothetical protein
VKYLPNNYTRRTEVAEENILQRAGENCRKKNFTISAVPELLQL